MASRADLDRQAALVARGPFPPAVSTRRSQDRRKYAQANATATHFNSGGGANGGAYLDSGRSLESIFGATISGFTIAMWFRFPVSVPSGPVGVFGASSSKTTNADGFGIHRVDSIIMLWAGAMADAEIIAVGVDTLWHHVVFGWDPTDGYLIYIDGVADTITASYPVIPIPAPSSATLRMGSVGDTASDTDGTYHSGISDEVMLFNRRLDGDEALRIYNDGESITYNPRAPGAILGLIDWWRMGDGAFDDPTFDTGVIQSFGPENMDMIPRLEGARAGVITLDDAVV